MDKMMLDRHADIKRVHVMGSWLCLIGNNFEDYNSNNGHA
ncbi:unnamed protein product [Urochloa humidicola]